MGYRRKPDRLFHYELLAVHDVEALAEVGLLFAYVAAVDGVDLAVCRGCHCACYNVLDAGSAVVGV